MQQQICDKHGREMKHRPIPDFMREEGVETSWPEWFCEECLEEARIKDEEELEESRRFEAQRHYDAHFANIGLGKRFRHSTFDNYKPENKAAEGIKSICLAYASSFSDKMESGASLLMCGHCGTGKNHLAASIAHHIFDNEFKPVLTTAIKVVRRVKDSWQKGSDETEQGIINSFNTPDLLIIDEVGVQFGSETERNILTEVINNRYESMKPVILISNLKPADLGEMIGERAVDRLKDNGGGVLIFNWESYRGR